MGNWSHSRGCSAGACVPSVIGMSYSFCTWKRSSTCEGYVSADFQWPMFHKRKRFTLKGTIVKTPVCRRCCPQIESATTDVTMGRYQQPCLD